MRVRRSARYTIRLLAAAAILVLAGAVVAGCGGSAAPTTTASGPLVTHVTNPAAGGQTVQVIMTDRSYQPKEVTIKVGDTVTWVNQDNPQHDVVADNGEFKSGLFTNGNTFSFTFTKAGTYPYHCSIHAGMTGTVIVQ